MMRKHKVVAIVDGFSTGKYFPSFLRKRGYNVIHIQSGIDIPGFLLQALRKEDYIENIIFDGDLAKLIGALNQYAILAIIPGTESAIYLTDQLSTALRLPGNPPESSELRRNKFSMVQAVNAGGLATAKQCKSANLDEILSWHSQQLKDVWPVVVKPINSAGTDSVRFCYNNAELITAVKNIIGKKNLLGIFNTEVLVQSFLSGQEYVVNTVSYCGKHHLTDIRRCYKKQMSGAGYVSGCEEFVPADDPISQQLKSYAFRALDLLQISQGPGHFEIMYTPDGPQIIEMGARVQGGINPAANALCLGYQQIDKTIDAYLEPSHFLTYYADDYTLHQFGLWVFLIAERVGRIISIPFIDKVKSLTSFFSIQMNVTPGEYLQRTIDYYSSPGSVHLVSPDKHQLMADLEQLRQFEMEGFVLDVNKATL